MPECLRCSLAISKDSSSKFSRIRLLSPDPRVKPFGSFVDSPGRRPDLGHQLAEPCHEESYPIIKKQEEKVLG